MSSYNKISANIDKIEARLEETKEAVGWNSGAVNDAMKLTIPMMLDLTGVMREILTEVQSHQHHDLSGGR